LVRRLCWSLLGLELVPCSTATRTATRSQGYKFQVQGHKRPEAQAPHDAWVISQNLKRRHLTPSEKAACAAEAEPLLATEAKERMRLGGGDKKSGRVIVPPPITGKGRARTHAAKAFGVPARYVSDAKSPETKSAWRMSCTARAAEIPAN